MQYISIQKQLLGLTPVATLLETLPLQMPVKPNFSLSKKTLQFYSC